MVFRFTAAWILHRFTSVSFLRGFGPYWHDSITADLLATHPWFKSPISPHLEGTALDSDLVTVETIWVQWTQCHGQQTSWRWFELRDMVCYLPESKDQEMAIEGWTWSDVHLNRCSSGVFQILPIRNIQQKLYLSGIFSLCYCPVLVNLCRFLFVTDRTGFLLLQHIWFNVPHVVFTDVFLILVDFLSAQTSLVVHCWWGPVIQRTSLWIRGVDQHVLKQSDQHVWHVQPCHLKSPFIHLLMLSLIFSRSSEPSLHVAAI